MRTISIIAVLLLGAALYVRGQAAEPGAPAAPAVAAGARAGAPGGLPPAAVPPPEAFFGSKLDWFLGQPGRVVVREVWDIGGVEGRPWDANRADPVGRVHVHAVLAYEDGKPNEKVKGLMLVLSDPAEDRTFLFDAEQVPELLTALEQVRAAADKLREPAQGARRRAVYVVNGLEISLDAGRRGGYLGAFGPDEITMHLNPDNFLQLRQLLEKAQEILVRAGR